MNSLKNTIWIFHGAQGRFPGGVFTTLEKAELWIKKHSLTGVLTEYPIDEGVYDWAIENELFAVKKNSQRAHIHPKFYDRQSRPFSLRKWRNELIFNPCPNPSLFRS